MPLDTSWMVWFTLATVAIWLVITQKLRIRVKKEVGEAKVIQVRDVECERFPDQCPCTTRVGKGIARSLRSQWKTSLPPQPHHAHNALGQRVGVSDPRHERFPNLQRSSPSLLGKHFGA